MRASAPPPVDRMRMVVGSALLLLLPALILALGLSEGVRRPLGRVLGVVAADWSQAPGDVELAVATTAGVHRGDPVFRADRPGSRDPVAWVASIGEGSIGLRFAAGEASAGPWRLRVLSPPRRLGDVLAWTAPSPLRERLEGDLVARLERVLEEGVLPELEARLPAFLDRIDPRGETPTRALVDTLGGAVMDRLDPHLDALASHVMRDLDRQLDLLDRVGLVWRAVRGDTDGLRRRIVPRVEQSAQAWWDAHRDEVLGDVGDAIAEHGDEVRTWLLEEVVPAARKELVEPVLEAQGPRLEAEAEDALDEIVDEVILAPDGGFRLRFTALLRAHLLGKRDPLLVLEAAQ